jgi:glycosyltransferase involved in cell wall biosynthesis
MRIGVSCLQIDPDYAGGVNTYALGLLEGFARLASNCRFRLYVTKTNQHLFEKFRKREHFELAVVEHLPFAAKKGICRATLLTGSPTFYKFTSDYLWEDIRRRIDSEVEVLYVPTVVLQFFNARKPTVLSMHDIQHVHYPEFFGWSRRLSRKITYCLSARHATYLQASSEFIKRDLMDHFRNLSPSQVEVIPEGVNLEDFAAPRGDSSLSARYGLPERYLLYPAQLWPHKNHLSVLAALKKIEREEHLQIPLILTGASFSAGKRILEYIAEQGMRYVQYLGKVPFADLVGLYQKAAFLVSAGLYESNSLPILEAAAAGAPVLASRIPPNEELGRTLQLNLFDPIDVNDLANVILSLWEDEKTASVQAAHNLRRIAQYSWENTARKYMQLFERIAS